MNAPKQNKFQWFIYELRDPRTDEARYVGCTLNPTQRLKNHILQARRPRANSTANTRSKAEWLCELISANLTPIIQIIECGTGGDGGRSAERNHIDKLRRAGATLFNNTSGGDGKFGITAPEVRARQSAAARARLQRPGEKERLAEQGRAAAKENRGKPFDPEWRARQVESRARNGKRWSEEARLRQAATLTGRKLSPEHRQNIAAGNIGKIHSPESRAKMSAARRERFLEKQKGKENQ